MGKKILVCTDFSEENLLSFKKHEKFLKTKDSELYICHILIPVLSLPIHNYYYPIDIDLEKNALKKAEEKMKETAKNLGINEENCSVFFGNPKKGIIDRAEEINADLIVLFGRKHSALGFLGSTSSSVLHNSKCEVLILNS